MDPRISRAVARIKAAEAVARRQARTDILADVLDDDEVDEVTALFPLWADDAVYTTDDLAVYAGVLYRCVQGHTAQPDWTPDAVPALWAAVRQTTGDTPDEWVQPQGSHDAYQIGDRVTFNGQVWESTHANNVWQPGSFGWQLV